MKIERYDMIVIGAGPAGLSAAIEAAKKGLKPIVFDENAKPGGQLFKQIHKFFGSKEHKLFIIKKELYTGHIGDGKIFVYDIDNVIRVRTGDEGVEAL